MMATAYEMVIREDGSLGFLWDDALADFTALGECDLQRASHVEPAKMPDGGPGWAADMGPSGGPVLGPFRLRGDALAAEVEWLRQRFFGG